MGAHVNTLGSVNLKIVGRTEYAMELDKEAPAISTLTVKLNSFVK